ncbi:MAG: efflux RND transporter periplasmic adaptor subunit [Gammaproteobacteria bacterium]|nr:efflux RND transporter periplasmic adaptor subunit [Gammaproteobacteria bacterium]
MSIHSFPWPQTLAAVAFVSVSLVSVGQTRAIRVTTAQPVRADIEQVEWAVGLIETRSSSQVAAEVAGKIVRVYVDEGQGVPAGGLLAEIDATAYELELAREQAEVKRLMALIGKQERELARARELAAQDLIAAEELEGLGADLDALREQRAGAQAELGTTQRRLTKTQMVAPVDGEVESRSVDVGDYVQVGTVAFDLIDLRNLRVTLPFPEYRAPEIRNGLPLRLTSVAAGDGVVEARVTDMRPGVNPSSRSVTVIVDFDNPGGWRPGASVRAELILGVREAALLVPQVAVVRRPAGDVVYVVTGEVVRERLIRRGERRDDQIEILEGLDGDEVIAVDGAGFLTDGATVAVAEG